MGPAGSQVVQDVRELVAENLLQADDGGVDGVGVVAESAAEMVVAALVVVKGAQDGPPSFLVGHGARGGIADVEGDDADGETVGCHEVGG